MYNFDEVVDRTKTTSMKWSPDVLKETFNVEDLLPLWVADMDFVAPDPIKNSVIKVAKHGIYGYSGSNKHIKAFVNWVERRHNWKVESDWILNTPGVVTALNLAVQTYTKPGDNIIIQRPVYYPFTNAIENNGRHVSSNSLILENGKYKIDFDDFEEKAKDPNTTMFILCSPHNPISRVYDKNELKKMMDICIQNNVLVVSDEIHNDLILPGYKHNVLANLDKSYGDNLITCMAPSKTFNLAGMQLSYIVISNKKLRHKFKRSMDQLSIGQSNPFAIEAATAAYNESEDWLDEFIIYLNSNYNYMKDILKKELPRVRVQELQATYLAWLDFRDYNLSVKELDKKIFEEAKVGLDGGSWFGPEGNGFMRINLACPRAILEKALKSIVSIMR